MRRKETNIEVLMENEFKRRKILFDKQILIEHIALVDFLFPGKIIVQCDGEYWHGKKNVKKRDGNQDLLLNFKGYKVIRLRESEIIKSPAKCAAKILRSLNVS